MNQHIKYTQKLACYYNDAPTLNMGKMLLAK